MLLFCGDAIVGNLVYFSLLSNMYISPVFRLMENVSTKPNTRKRVGGGGGGGVARGVFLCILLALTLLTTNDAFSLAFIFILT